MLDSCNAKGSKVVCRLNVYRRRDCFVSTSYHSLPILCNCQQCAIQKVEKSLFLY